MKRGEVVHSYEILKYEKERDQKAIISMLSENDYYTDVFMKNDENHADYIFVAYVNKQVAGLISFDGIKRIANLILSVAKEYRRQGLGSKLLEYAEDIFLKHEVIEHSRFLKVKDEDTVFKQFLMSKEFRVSLSFYSMEREGSSLPAPEINVRNYATGDYYDWHRIEEVAFFKMRESIGVYPSHYYPPLDTEKSEYLKDKDNRYVLIEDNKIIAIAIVRGNELESIAVAPEYQAKGYGCKFASYLINNILKNGHSKVTLGVAKGNSAVKLYEKLGFKETQMGHVYVKYYRPDTRMRKPPSHMLKV